MGLMQNKALWVTLMSGGATFTDAQSAAAAMLAAESQGLAIDFTDDAFLGRDFFYGSAEIKDTGTPANNYSAAPTKTASSLLTYTSPSPKMVMGPSGTLRYAAHNLIGYSNNVADTTWTSFRCTKAQSGDGARSDQAATLVTSTSDLSTPGAFLTFSAISGATYTYTLDVKAGTSSWCVIDLNFNSTSFGKYVNLAGGTLGGNFGSAPDSSSITSLGNGWYRVTITHTPATVGTPYAEFYIASADGATTSTNGQTFYVSTPHVFRAPADSTYISTGVVATARYALPLEWSSGGSSINGLLVEESRTNLALYASDLTNAAWTKSNLTTAKTATGPDGVANSATTCTATAGNATALQAITSGSAARISNMWIKRRTGSGVVNITSDNGTTWTAVTVTSSWTRVESTVQTLTNPTVGIRIVTSGDAVDVALFQHEVGSFSTSAIETFASTVTRAADVISLAATAFPSVLTAATFSAEYSLTFRDPSGNSQFAARIVDGAGNNSISLYGNNGAAASSVLVVSGAATQSNQSVANTLSATNKIAIGVTTNDAAFYVNGTAATADTSVTMPTALDTLWIGGLSSTTGFPHRLGVPLRKLMLIPRRMSNAELITLTT
jgi:hypothetical protein